MGNTTNQEEHVLTLMRSAKFLTELAEGGLEDSKENMLAAIDRLNKRHEGKLTHHVTARWIRAATKAQVKEVCTYEPYCEDQYLSISAGGELYRALYIPPETNAISDACRQELLRVLCTFYSVENCRPKNKGEKMDAWNWMQNASRSGQRSDD